MDINQLKNPKEVERLAQSLQAAHIGHELVMTDNIYSSIPMDSDGNIPMSYPVKVVGASLVICKKGNITFRVNLSDHTLKGGDVLIILPGSIMQVVGADEDLKIATVSFASFYHEAIVDVSSQMRENPMISPSESDLNECLTIYHLLYNRLAKKSDESTRIIAKGYLSVICTILFSYWKNVNPEVETTNSRPKELYRRFLGKVQDDYHSHRSLKHYADCLCVTPKYLSMVVKQESGRNASDFIDELVIFESKALLRDGRYTIEQVAEVMQFPNPSFFSRFFKRLCGVSPSVYRKE